MISILFPPAPPTILQRPTNQTAVEGSQVTLVCKASGSPKPKIIWRLNKQNLRNGNVLTNSSLVINDVQNNEAYEGRYTCHALSPMGSAQASAYIQVFGMVTLSRASLLFFLIWRVLRILFFMVLSVGFPYFTNVVQLLYSLSGWFHLNCSSTGTGFS